MSTDKLTTSTPVPRRGCSRNAVRLPETRRVPCSLNEFTFGVTKVSIYVSVGGGCEGEQRSKEAVVGAAARESSQRT